MAIGMDCSDEAQVASRVSAVVKNLGPIDVLHAKRVPSMKPAVELTFEDWDSISTSTPRGVLTNREVGQAFPRRGEGGSIVNTASWRRNGRAASGALLGQ